MEMQKSRIGIMALLVVALVAASAIFTSEAASVEHNCVPTRSPPIYDERVVSSKDNTAIVSLGAYVQYYDRNGTNTYTLIDAQQLHRQRDSDYEYLTLTSSCNVLKMALRKVKRGFQFEKVEVSSKSPSGEVKHLCTASMVKPFFVVPKANSYSYEAVQTWDCDTFDSDKKPADDSIVWLRINKLKFEIDGNQEKIGEKQFSKPAREFFSLTGPHRY